MWRPKGWKQPFSKSVYNAAFELGADAMLEALKKQGFCGEIVHVGFNYDEHGHTDDYDIMFGNPDYDWEICLNGMEELIYDLFGPVSVHDRLKACLALIPLEGDENG
ncbi:MAG: hypothetical protein JRC53_05385 [Deltaproteobacteria bacterium]|nr:hypothetical protein [Deltaproteobacteria bacterium]